MSMPTWMRGTGQAMAIALSALPIIASVPSVIAAHDVLDRDVKLMHEHRSTAGTGPVDVTAMLAAPWNTTPNQTVAHAARLRYQ